MKGISRRIRTVFQNDQKGMTMRTVVNCFTILIILLVSAYDVFPYEYTWGDYRRPFTQLIKVPAYTHGNSSVYIELPLEVLNTHESLTLHLDIESNFTLTIDGSETRTFEGWSAYCSVNRGFWFGKHRLRVNHVPARQDSSIRIQTKDLKAGGNTLEFSMAADNPGIKYGTKGGQVPIAYGIHKMWFSEFSAPPQESTVQKVKDAPLDKAKPRDVWHLEAVSISPMSKTGNRCGEVTATVYVQGNVAKGTGRNSLGNDLEFSGSVDSNGRMEVGVISGNEPLGTYTGVITSGDSANGIWQDKFQCFGTWSATKQQQGEPVRKQPDSDIATKPEVFNRIKLRDRAEKKFSDQDLQKMIKERNFFNSKINPGGHFPNALVDNGDGTVTDKVTGLMWQKGGSPSEMPFYATGKYLDELNSSRFGGYGDWRLPTMDELCSLLEGTQNKSGKFMDNLFDPLKGNCWSADENQRYSGTRLAVPVKAAFFVSFSGGETTAGNAERFQPTNESRCYVRAVRTAE